MVAIFCTGRKSHHSAEPAGRIRAILITAVWLIWQFACCAGISFFACSRVLNIERPVQAARCPPLEQLSNRAADRPRLMSASLIGRLGSSAFRLSTCTVSMSLTGSCFSSDSALGPFHHGVRRRGGTIFGSTLPSDRRQVQADIRTRLIHRPARDIIPPLGGARVFSYRI
jgi:hypothetical protein